MMIRRLSVPEETNRTLSDIADWDACDDHETTFPKGDACPKCEAETDDGYEGGCQNCGRLIDKSAKGYDDVVLAPYVTESGDLYCIPCGREQDRAQREVDEAEGFGDYDPYGDREPPEPDGECYRGSKDANGEWQLPEPPEPDTCPTCGREHNRQCNDGWHI